MTDEQGFFTRLTALASMIPNFVLTKEMIEIYDRLLSPLGYDNLCYALEQIISERGSRDPFPSVKEIRAILAPSLDPESEAIEASNRIIEAVAKDGWTNTDRARARIGELGWSVVQSAGGWQAVCESLNSKNIPQFKAQFRDLARARQLRITSGYGDEAPKLPHAPEKTPQGGLRTFGSILKSLAQPRERGNSNEKENQKGSQDDQEEDNKA